jgi:hypothetical protein
MVDGLPVPSMGARRCPYTPGTFRAVRWVDGPIWIVCRSCRRYVELMMTTDVAERQVSGARFTCTACGGEGSIASEDPAGQGYALEPRDNARRRPKPVERRQPPAEPLSAPWWRPTF